jgi:D-3-phosphoglycerate dehydrogenase
MFLSQLAEGRHQHLEITYSGEITRHDLSSLTMAAARGLLYPILKETVNYINAMALCKERGIKVSEAKSADDKEFVTLIQLNLKTDKVSKVVAGTLSANKQPRIVKIDEYYVEVQPSGEMVFIQNWDRPGIIGNLGTLMGRHNINIAAMTFGRDEPGGKAISVLNVDSPVSPKVLAEVKKIENILEAKIIRV